MPRKNITVLKALYAYFVEERREEKKIKDDGIGKYIEEQRHFSDDVHLSTG